LLTARGAADKGSSCRHLVSRHVNLVYSVAMRQVRDQLDQLGLELVPTNKPIEMLVVEKAKD
jgi:hypothetical protein